MKTTEPLTDDERIEELKNEIIDTLLQVGIDPVPYSIAIKLTAETLRAREKAYKEYRDSGGQMEAVFATWNDQACTCLSMLKLTPRELHNIMEG